MSFATGKRILISGANSGIGYESARQLAAYGAEVIMLCRSPKRAEQARKAILDQDPDADLSLFIADLASPSSIDKAVRALRQRYPSIHVLINNAGGYFPAPHLAEDGLEYTFALNHMGPFRLTAGLMDRLQTGAEEIQSPARVITVSSAGHRFSPITSIEQLQDLPKPAKYRGFQAYCRSKLANILFTRELHERFHTKGIAAVSLHPGFVRSNFGNLESGRPSSRLFHLGAKMFAIPPHRGASTQVFLADAESILSGMYYEKCQLRKPSSFARNSDLARELWSLSQKLS